MFFLIQVSFAFLGAVTASFVGVIAERVYTGQSWRSGRSKCNSCREVLDARDLFPVVSWFFYRGRCRICSARVSARYMMSEALFAGLFVYGYVHLGPSIELFFFLLTLAVLLFIVLYDIKHTVVPNIASTLLILSSLCFAYNTLSTPVSFGLILMTAGIISLGFFLLHILSGGRAMGLGDAPVVFALSLFVGSQAISGLLFSFWIGALFGIILLLVRRGGPTMGIEVPFVPFMALGYLLAYITQWNALGLFTIF